MSSRAKIIAKDSANLEPLRDKTVAILGFGSQGAAHAMNLRDSGCNVIVAQRTGSPRHDAALDAGFMPHSIEEATLAADLLLFGLPDDAMGGIFDQQIQPHLRAGQTLGFMHGFAIHCELVRPPTNVDVVLVAPKSQGRGVRNEYLAGRGVLALIAMHQDASGQARDRALAWAAGIGSARAGLIETTFKDETETDLFGEQAVLCGGLTALIKSGFETLVEAGYPAELAYFECCHEVKLLADLIHAGGVEFMRRNISSTARFGDLTRGPRIVSPRVRDEMRQILAEIRSGEFAREFIDDAQSGGQKAEKLMRADEPHPLEAVGRRLRQLMWNNKVKPD